MFGLIFHLDMDAFYASIEQRDNPALRGRPVIVGGPPTQRGVVCAASYEARRFGVRSAMPSVTAGRLCPDGVFIRPRMEDYREESRKIMALVEQTGALVEQVSIDEAYLDVAPAMIPAIPPVGSPDRVSERPLSLPFAFATAAADEGSLSPAAGESDGGRGTLAGSEALGAHNACALFSKKDDPARVVDIDAALYAAVPLARELKRRIASERGLTASIGIAANKLLAKLASDFSKPNGLTLIPERDKVLFLRPMPVRVIPGVGRVTEQALRRVGIVTVGDLQDYPGDLRALVGSFGPRLKQFAFGSDDPPLELGG